MLHSRTPAGFRVQLLPVCVAAPPSIRQCEFFLCSRQGVTPESRLEFIPFALGSAPGEMDRIPSSSLLERRGGSSDSRPGPGVTTEGCGERSVAGFVPKPEQVLVRGLQREGPVPALSPAMSKPMDGNICLSRQNKKAKLKLVSADSLCSWTSQNLEMLQLLG